MTTRRQQNQYGLDVGSRLAGVGLLLLLAGVAAVAGFGCDTAATSLDAGGSATGNANTPAAAAPGAPAPEALAPAAAAADQVVRDIEEADIVKIVGDKLYALNTYKGLLVVDVTNPDAPALVGTYDFHGRGVEMYVSDLRVYVVLSADYYYPMMAGMGGAMAGEVMVRSDGPMPPAPDFEGSQLAIIDVTDPAAPALQGKINLVGYASESRRVGDVIYIIGSNYVPWGYDRPADQPTDEGFVASVNVADPTNIIPVDRKAISGNALVMHVSQTALFAASQDWDPNSGDTITVVQAVDISDPAGAITIRGSVNVPGSIQDRFYLDAYEDALRIATDSWGFGYQQVRLYTYSLADMDNITPLGQVDIEQNESLQAVRFDGPRGYVVTFLVTDPLFVLDLHDPANPVVSGHLVVPGYSTHIEPRDTRLIAVGIDDTDGQRPALAYYDVADPANPSELGRVVLGPPGSFTESQATYDEKAFKIVDELGLIAMPFKHVDWSNIQSRPVAPMPMGGGMGTAGSTDPASGTTTADQPTCINAVQLVDFNDAGLQKRGYFEHQGYVERVGVVGTRVFALSEVALQTVDITDRDNPVKAGQVNFFSEEEMPWYADDCGYYDYSGDVVITPPDGSTNPMQVLINIFVNGNLCGSTSALPGALMPLGLVLMMAAGARRRSR